MTVTRKDLNEIASTFNQRLLLLNAKASKTNLHTPKNHQAREVWHTAEAMFGTLQVLNPAVDYEKWRKAVTRGCDFEFMHHDYCRRVMADEQCLELANDLIDNGLEFETVKMDDLTTDVENPITRADWVIVLERMNTLEQCQ